MVAPIVGYGTFEYTDKGTSESNWVATAPSIDDVKSAIDRFQKSDSPPVSSSDSQETVDVESEVGRGIWTFYKQLKSYYEVAGSAEILSRAWVNSYFKRQVQEHAKINFIVSEIYNEVPIYGLSEADMANVNDRIDRWNSISDGFDKLPASVLLSLVAGFDSAFADFAKILLKSKPERYSGSDRQYSVSEILKLDSLEQLINKAADDEVEVLMSKSHTDQVAFFERSFGISIKEHYERWSDFVEIFERRNLAAHGSLRVNTRYIDNCLKGGYNAKVTIGELLSVDTKYLESSIDILIEFGMLLALSAWQKQYPKSIKESFGAVVEVSYSLLKDNRPFVAARLVEYGMKVRSKGADEENTKMMTVNLAIAYRQSGDKQKALDLLEKTDWSASPPQFRLCNAAIKDDVETSIGLLEAAKISDNLSMWAIREWPAFQWIRSNESFRAACAKVFGEELAPVKVIKSDVQKVGSEEAAVDITPPPPPAPHAPSPATAPDTAP